MLNEDKLCRWCWHVGSDITHTIDVYRLRYHLLYTSHTTSVPMGRNDISPQPFEVTGYDRTAGAHRTDAYRLMILVGITMRWYSSTDKSSYHKRGYAPAVSVINKLEAGLSGR